MPNFMKTHILTILIISTIILSSCDISSTTKRQDESSGVAKKSAIDNITCLIESDNEVYKVGQVPNIIVKITNNSDSTILLVNSLDGSSHKMRFPHSFFKIEKLDDTTYKTKSYGRCGNMNSLQPSDFTEVKSGETFNPYSPDKKTFSDYKIKDPSNFIKAGKYKITYYYSTNELDFKKWLGDGSFDYVDQKTGQLKTLDNEESRNLFSLFSKVPKVDIVSNTLTIDIK